MKFKIMSLVLFFVVSGLVLFQFYAPNEERKGLAVGNAVGSVEEIVDGVNISQSFFSHNNGLSGIDLLPATYARENSCVVHVTLNETDSGNIVYETYFSGTEISDSVYRRFNFEPLNSLNKNYIITVSTDAVPGNGITMWVSAADQYSEGDLFVNGSAQESDICFNTYYTDLSAIGRRPLLFVGLLLISCTITAVALFKKSSKKVLVTLSVISSAVYAVSLFSVNWWCSNDVYYSLKGSVIYYLLCSAIIAAFNFIIILNESTFKLDEKIKSKFLLYVNGQKELLGNIRKNKFKFIWHILTIIATVIFIENSVVLMFSYSEVAIICIFAEACVMFLLWFVEILFVKGGSNYSQLFAVTALLVGWVLSFSLPLTTGVSWDDETHFASALDTVCKFTGQEITVAEQVYSSRAYMGIWQGDYDFVNLLYDQLDVESNSYQNYNPVWSPVAESPLYRMAYSPVIICLLVMRILRLPFPIVIILSRFSTCALFTLIIYLGMKKLKSGQLLLSAIMLIPTSLFLVSVHSYDYWVIAFCSYSVTHFLSILQMPEAKFTNKDTAIICATMFLGSGPKVVYIALMFMFFFAGRDKFQSTKQYKTYWICCIATILVALAAFILSGLTAESALTDIRGGADVNGKAQIQFILSEPLEYTKILLKFIPEYFSLEFMVRVCGAFGYIKSDTYTFVASMVVVIIAFAACTDRSKSERFKGALRIKIAILISVFAALCLVCTALYIGFTPVGCPTIHGVQWRYCLPILFPFLYALGSFNIRVNISKNLQGVVVYGGMFFVFASSYFFAYILNYII